MENCFIGAVRPDAYIASGQQLSEAGYLARILFHLDVVPNDFMVGVLWSELNWTLRHEPNALLGERFDKQSSLDPANAARVRRAEEDEREIFKIAQSLELSQFETTDGKLKVRPLARLVKKKLDQNATRRSCGLRKIEDCLKKRFKK